MSKNVRSIYKLSWSIRNLLTTRNNILPARLFHSSPVIERRFSRHPIHNQNEITEKSSEHIITKTKTTLNECKTPEHIFGFIREYPYKLKGRGAVHCLAILYEAIKRDPTAYSYISSTTEFSKICETIRKNIREIDTKTAITGLKCLTYFNVNASTYVVQLLLQIIRDSVNNLSIEQIYFLQFLLTKMESTPLCEALKIALPLVFTTQVNTQLDTGNIDAVINTLQYMRKTNIDDALVPKILKIISTKHLTILTPIQAKQTLFCVLDWKRSKETAGLVPQLINILLKKIDVLDGHEIRAILIKLVTNYETEKNAEIAANYYNDAFLDACVGVAVGKDVGFNCALNILSNINFFRHSNTSLLDYIAAKCFEKPELLNNATKYDLKSILYGLSLAEYKPVFWETMKDSMMNKNLLDFPLPILTKICVYLMSLDCYWPELIEKIFTTFEIKHDDYSSLKTRFTIIHSAVKNDYPQYSGAWPNYEIIEKSTISPNLKDEHFEVLKTAVEFSLGGPQYIHTNLSTKLGLIIDHVAIMRKGGFPIAINNHGDVKPTKVEDLQPPPDSQVILFYFTPYASCPRNTERLSGVWSLYIKQLALTTKATVIPIPKKKWLKFTEAEQIRYISQALRLKCDELSAVVN